MFYYICSSFKFQLIPLFSAAAPLTNQRTRERKLSALNTFLLKLCCYSQPVKQPDSTEGDTALICAHRGLSKSQTTEEKEQQTLFRRVSGEMCHYGNLEWKTWQFSESERRDYCKSSPLSQPAFPPASAALNSPEQKPTLRLWIKPPLRTEKGARRLHVHRRTTTQREQQSAGQEGLQKPKKAVCLMGKLQVVILCMSAHVKKNVLPQSRLITVVAATHSYISRKNIKLQCRFNAHNWSFSHGFTKKWL